jgi:hypothetical protein
VISFQVLQAGGLGRAVLWTVAAIDRSG